MQVLRRSKKIRSFSAAFLKIRRKAAFPQLLRRAAFYFRKGTKSVVSVSKVTKL